MPNMPTPSIPSTQPTNSATSPQKRPGRQRGSQGYSGEDCTALVEIIKGILPLESNEWERVHELYSDYAIQNDQILRDTDPLKTKFKVLVMSKKPTGDPSCPVWVLEAKRTNYMIKDRARSLAFVDEEEGDSADET